MKREKKPQQPLNTRVRSALRKVDGYSTEAMAVKTRAAHPTRKKWFVCELCKQDTPFIKQDHVVPVGTLEKDLSNIKEWCDRLFVPSDKRQALCDACHAPKTKAENKARREQKKRSK